MDPSDHEDALPGDGLEHPPPSDELGAQAMWRRLSLRLFDEVVAPAAIGRFEVMSTIGAGGMGVVVQARDPKLGRSVALKLLRSTEDPTVARRLEQEALALARLNHPHVVQVYEVGEHEGQVFLAMEYVDGGSLRDWLAERPRTWREILDKYLQAGAGLAAAHRVGIVHRDFKPTNVLIDRDGRVRVADFGLAREASSEHERLGDESRDASTGPLLGTITRSGRVVGTPAYMSPEQLEGKELDARTDVFSFCVALWEALAGTRPFRPERLRRALLEPSEPLPVHGRPAGPRWLARALRRGLAIDPELRWPSMEALLTVLTRTPVQQRRMIASLGVVGLGLGGWFAWPADLPSPCPSAAAELGGAWDEERREQVDTLVSASKLDFAAETWREVETGLDAYAAGWLEARQATCEATKVHGRQSQEQLDLSIACLDRRRGGLAVAVELLVEGRTEVWVGATDLVDALEPVDPCTSTQALRGAAARGVARSAALDELDRVLADGHARLAVKLLDEGHRAAEVAAREARRLGDSSRLAEALHMKGSAEGLLGEGERALSSLTEAVDLAFELDDDGQLARSFVALGRVAVVELEDAEGGRRWLDHAAALSRRPDASQVLRVDLALARADLASLLGRPADALDELSGARTWTGKSDAQELALMSALAKLLGEQGRLDESDALYLEAIERQSKRLGEGHPSTVPWRLNLAINELERPHPDLERAWSLCDEALAGYRAAYGAHDRRLAGILVTMAQLAWQRGQSEEAMGRARRAAAIVRETLPEGHSERVGALALLANILVEMGHHEEALLLHEKLLREHVVGGNQAEQPRARQNLAWLLCQTQQCERAQEHIDAARAQLPAGDELHVLLDVVQGMVRLARGDAAEAVAVLEAVALRVDGVSAEEHPLLRPELAATLARALALQGSDLARARGLAEQAREGYRALGREREAAEVETWMAAMGLADEGGQ